MKLPNVNKLNDAIAAKATLVFGSMWATYVFFLYGFIPVILPQYMPTLLYWSNTVQLWSLPLLMVGTVVLGRAAEARDDARAQETHDAVMQELADLKELLDIQKAKECNGCQCARD